MSVRLTERDLRLLAKCAPARRLTTSQIQRGFFPTATPDAVRKRLRKLAEGGYLRSYQPNQMAEALHALGPQGKPVLEGKGLTVEVEKGVPKQVEHLVGINDIRVAVECGGIPVVFFFAAWELGSVGWFYHVIPDAVFALQVPRRLTFMVEYDRGTETVGLFSKKIRSYEQGLDGFPFDAVLIVAETEGRLESLSRAIRRQAFSERTYLTALLAEIRTAGVSAPVFQVIAACDTWQGKVSLKDFGDLADPALSCK